jgi:hypothetical protein
VTTDLVSPLVSFIPFLRKLITDKAETPVVEAAIVDSGPLFCADA